MSEIKQSPVLAYLVDVLSQSITDSKIEKISENESVVIDGSDKIFFKQQPDTNGADVVLITDKKEILYSEELLEMVYKIHEVAKSNPELKAALSAAKIIINGLHVETELIFHTVRDEFYGLNSSYEFLKFIDRGVQQVSFTMTFVDHKFNVIISNGADVVSLSTEIADSVPAAVKKIIHTDLNEVIAEITSQFKKEAVVG